MPSNRFILHRLLQMLVVLIGTITVLFLVIYLMVPGDAAQVALGDHATPGRWIPSGTNWGSINPSGNNMEFISPVSPISISGPRMN